MTVSLFHTPISLFSSLFPIFFFSLSFFSFPPLLPQILQFLNFCQKFSCVCMVFFFLLFLPSFLLLLSHLLKSISLFTPALRSSVKWPWWAVTRSWTGICCKGWSWKEISVHWSRSEDFLAPRRSTPQLQARYINSITWEFLGNLTRYTRFFL